MMSSPDLCRLLPDDDERLRRRDALVRELRTRPVPRARLTRRRFALASMAATVVVAIAGGSLVIPGTRGKTIDVVSEARAALLPQGAIVHVKVRYERARYESMATLHEGSRTIGRDTGAFERWSATNPLRNRSIVFLEPPGGGPLATIETDYANGIWRSHKSWRDDVWLSRANGQERRDFEARRGRSHLEALQISLDPIAAIRTLLSDGKLHAQGRVERNDREVLRLVGTTEYGDRGGRLTSIYEYFIDPETYAPLQIVSTEILAARPDAPAPEARHERRIIQRWIFQTFERLPLTKDTASLLRMNVTGLAVKHVEWSPYRL
jgi:hypothetical protein